MMSPDTFTNLLTPNLKPLRRLLEARLRAPDQVEDVFQQTLLLAFMRRDQLRAESKFRSWLWSIAFNEMRGLMRGAKPGFSLDEYPNFELPDQAEGPERAAERAERAGWLYNAMSALTERDREAIRLVDLNEMTIVEAAAKLALTKAAAKSAYFRARLRLGRALRPEAPMKRRKTAKTRHAQTARAMA